MNPMTSWNDALSAVEQDDHGKWDIEKDARSIRMNDEGSLVLNDSGESYPVRMSDFALTQLCGKLNLPARYIKRIPPALQSRCVNNDLAKAAEEDRRFLVRCRGDIARAFLSSKYSRVDNIEFLKIFEKLSRGFQHQVRSFSLSESGMWMKILVDDLRTWDPSDTANELKIGLVVGNSEIGIRRITLESFIYRKACCNDAVFQSDGALDVRHIHLNHRELRGRIAEAMNTALKNGDEVLDSFVRSYEQPIADPAALIQRLAEKRGMSKELTDSVQLAYQVEPMKNKYGLVNAFSRAAQTLEADDRVEMERYAGSLLVEPEANRLAA